MNYLLLLDLCTRSAVSSVIPMLSSISTHALEKLTKVSILGAESSSKSGPSSSKHKIFLCRTWGQVLLMWYYLACFSFFYFNLLVCLIDKQITQHYQSELSLYSYDVKNFSYPFQFHFLFPFLFLISRYVHIFTGLLLFIIQCCELWLLSCHSENLECLRNISSCTIKLLFQWHSWWISVCLKSSHVPNI